MKGTALKADPASPIRIGYLAGSDYQSGGIVAEDQRIRNEGSTDVYKLRDRRLDNWTRLHIPRNYLRLHGQYDLRRFAMLVNLVTDPDQNPRLLDVLGKILRGYRGRILNRPEAVLRSTREGVARSLAGIDGLIVPRIARFPGKIAVAIHAIDRAGLEFPAILRLAGSHMGRIVGMVDGPDALAALIEPDQTYLLTSFVDSRRADGFYRKTRIFFFGERGVLRHHLASDEWSIHAADRERIMVQRPALLDEEAGIVGGGYDALPVPTRAILGAIRAKLGLDFFGIDLALLDDGRVLLFEANATMNFFPFPDDPRFAYLTPSLSWGQEAFGAMLHPDGTPEQD